MRTPAISLMVIALLAVALVGCSKPPAPPPAAPPASYQPARPEAAAPPAEAPKTDEAAKPADEKAESAKTAEKGKAVGPKLEGEEGKTPVATKTGLKYIVLEEGKGSKPQKGATIVAEYTGWLTDGKKFDSSKDHPGEFSFQVGLGQVVPGWDEALSDMKVGERRKLIVPPDLGYGSKGAGDVIPPDATLVFEVTLVKIK